MTRGELDRSELRAANNATLLAEKILNMQSGTTIAVDDLQAFINEECNGLVTQVPPSRSSRTNRSTTSRYTGVARQITLLERRRQTNEPSRNASRHDYNKTLSLADYVYSPLATPSSFNAPKRMISTNMNSDKD